MAKRKKERAGDPHGYIFKLSPTARQHDELMQQARMVTDLRNTLLSRNEDLHRRTRGQKGVVHKETDKYHFSAIDMSYDISAMREDCPEWKLLSTWTPRRVSDALAGAFDHFFRRMKELSNPATYEHRAAEFRSRKGRNPTRYELAGYPKYRSIRMANWVPHRFVSGCNLRPESLERKRKNGRKSYCNWRLKLKGVSGEIRARGEFPQDPLAWLNADIRYRDGTWWLAVGIETKPERQPGRADITIRFDLLDKIAVVTANDDTLSIPDFSSLAIMQDAIDALKADRDIRWPRQVGKRPSWKHREINTKISHMSARVARIRKEILHKWTTDLVSGARRITIIAPPIRAVTRSAKGHEKSWGAAVEPVAALNRHVLLQAPRIAIDMLKYKAKEAEIDCLVIDDQPSPLDIGKDLSMTKKLSRKANRDLRKDAA